MCISLYVYHFFLRKALSIGKHLEFTYAELRAAALEN